MRTPRIIGCATLLCGAAAVAAWAEEIPAFDITAPGTALSMRGLQQGARDATDGASDFSVNAPPRYPVNEDHLFQNWWYIRQRVQVRVNGVWMDSGVDPREYSLGEPANVPQESGARTQRFGDSKVRLGYNARRPVGAPAGITPQPIDITYEAFPGVVTVRLELGAPDGLGVNTRMLTDLFWLVDIDAHGTPGNDRIPAANQSGGTIRAEFDDTMLRLAPLFVGARSQTDRQEYFRGRIDTVANLRGLMTNGVADDLPAAFANLGAGGPGDYAILFQWRLRRGGGAERDLDDEYEPVTGVYTVEYESNSNTCVGDLDHDQDVDLSDMAALLGAFGVASGATWEMGDLDYDGDVELADLARMLTSFGSVCD